MLSVLTRRGSPGWPQPRFDADLDLDLAVEESSKNPVYYVQYAHARIASILRSVSAVAGRRRLVTECRRGACRARPGARPRTAAARRARGRRPSRAASRQPLSGRVADEFHVFYRECKVLTDETDVGAFRVGLCRATRTSLAIGLQLLGVTAPDRM